MKKNTFVACLIIGIFAANVAVQVGWTGTWFSNLEMFNPPLEFNKPADALPWVYEDWNYRKKNIVPYIMNEEVGAGYQMRFVVHYGSGVDSGANVYLEGRCQDDFDDIRFSDNLGTELSYWIEPFLPGEHAVFWVKLDQDISFGTQYVYIYYGNIYAKTTSSGDDTFIFFDDFEDDTEGTPPSKWSSSIRTTIVTDRVSSGSKSAYLGNSANLYKEFDTAFTHGIMIQHDFNIESTLRGIGCLIYNDQSPRESCYYARTMESDISEIFYNDGTYRPWSGCGDSYNDDTWYTMSVGFDQDSSDPDMKLFMDGVYIGEEDQHESDDTDWETQNIDLIYFCTQNSYPGWIDNVFVRKWIPDEPTHDIWDSEESNPNFHCEDLSDWEFCIPHIIERADGAGTNYQMRFVVCKVGTTHDEYVVVPDCNDDFSDVRFVDSQGRVLDYWIEWISSLGGHAYFWVEILDDLSAADSTIYVYWGNPEATSKSNGEATFLFFDDFDGSSLDTEKWLHCGDPDSYSVTGSVFYQPNDNSYLQGIATRYPFSTPGTSVSVSATAENPDGMSNGNVAGIWIDNTYPSESNIFNVDEINTISLRHTQNGGNNVNIVHKGESTVYYSNLWTPGVFRKLSIDRYNPGARYSYLDGAVQQEFSTAYSGYQCYIYLLGNGPPVRQAYDWIFVRKISLHDEPQHGSWNAASGFSLVTTDLLDELPLNDDFTWWSNRMIPEGTFWLPNNWDPKDGTSVAESSGGFTGKDSISGDNREAVNLSGKNPCILEQSLSSSISFLSGKTVDFSFKFRGNEEASDDYGRAIIKYRIGSESTEVQGDFSKTQDLDSNEWDSAVVRCQFPSQLDEVVLRIEIWRFDGKNVSVNVDATELCISGASHVSYSPQSDGYFEVAITQSEADDNHRARIGIILRANAIRSLRWIRSLKVTLSSPGEQFHADLFAMTESNNLNWFVMGDAEDYDDDQYLAIGQLGATGSKLGFGFAWTLAKKLILDAFPKILLTTPQTIGLWAVSQVVSYAIELAWQAVPGDTVIANYASSSSENFLSSAELMTVWDVNDIVDYVKIHIDVSWGGDIVWNQGTYYLMESGVSSMDIYLPMPS